MIKVTWTGAAGLQFETKNGTILIDPYHTRVDIFNTLIGAISTDEVAVNDCLPEMERVRAIIVGHTHSDHALDVPYIAARSDCPVVGSSSLDTLMNLNAMPGRVQVCAGGETVELGRDASVTMLRSTHGLVAMGKVPFPGEIRATNTLPMKASGYRVGTVFAPLLRIEDTVFIHVGSANFIDAEMEGRTCDVLFLCVPGWKKRKGYPQRLIEMTQPKTVVLFHYEDFSKPHKKGSRTRMLPFTDLKGMIRQIESQAPQVEVIVPEPFETLNLSC